MHRLDRADCLLAITGLFFLAAVVAHLSFETQLSRLCLIISESSLVGGIADWFAVSALFRKPLGVSWHTNLILRNRQQAEVALIELIVNDLLNEQLLKQRFSRFPFTQRILANPLDPTSKESIIRFFKYRIGKYLSPSNISSFSVFIAQRFRRNMQKGEIPGWFIFPYTFVDGILSELNRETLLPHVRVALEAILPNNFILRWLLTSSSFIVDLDTASTAVTDALLAKIVEIRQDLHHPLRLVFQSSVRKTADQARLDETFLQRLPLESLITTVIALAREELDLESFHPEAPLEQWLFDLLDRWQLSLLANQKAKEILDTSMGSLIAYALRSDHDKIGKLVQEKLVWMTDNELVSLIRKPIQADLIRIRTNGSIIGGTLGLIYGILYELML